MKLKLVKGPLGSDLKRAVREWGAKRTARGLRLISDRRAQRTARVQGLGTYYGLPCPALPPSSAEPLSTYLLRFLPPTLLNITIDVNQRYEGVRFWRGTELPHQNQPDLTISEPPYLNPNKLQIESRH
jgi:hypothetical protein